jgi:hypothetical protein
MLERLISKSRNSNGAESKILSYAPAWNPTRQD